MKLQFKTKCLPLIKKIAEKLEKLPNALREDGYPDVQAFMSTYRKVETVVEQYNCDLAAWERQFREKETRSKRAGKAATTGERTEIPAPISGGGQAAKPAETEKEIL